jgi:hypothetical protein
MFLKEQYNTSSVTTTIVALGPVKSGCAQGSKMEQFELGYELTLLEGRGSQIETCKKAGVITFIQMVRSTKCQMGIFTRRGATVVEQSIHEGGPGSSITYLDFLVVGHSFGLQ